MGGRYGASDDGSDDYQDRRPDEADRSDEQQTIAEAVQAVADHHADDGGSASGQADNGDGSSGGGSGQHPFTSLRPGTSRTDSSTLQAVDQKIAAYVADELVESARWAVEETESDDHADQ